MKPDLPIEKDLGSLNMNRRRFLKLSGGGLFVFFFLGDTEIFAQDAHGRRSAGELPPDFNAYLRIKEDGRVTCFTGKIEMGQGVITSLAQMLADELNVALDDVDMLMGDTDLCPWDMGTFGSRTTRFFGPPLRAAAAEARQVLMEMASAELKAPLAHLSVQKGEVFVTKTPKKRISYAALTQGKRIEKHLQGPASVKKPSEFTIVNRPVLRRDAYEKVTGMAEYAGDIRLEGMLYAKILRPPAHGARLVSVDVKPAKEIEGVEIVREGDLIAALHRYPDLAEAALAKIKAEWDVPASDLTDENIFDHLLKVAPAGEITANGGDLNTGIHSAAQVFKETYLDGYVAHAPMEPHTAVAHVDENGATVWASTQTPFRAKEEAAAALGIPAENVRVVTPFVGGGFGGKTRNLQVVEAVRLAKLAGKPVQVAWSRQEEFFNDSFRPAAVVKIDSGLDNDGRVNYWDYRVYFAGGRGAEHFYDIPHHRTTLHGSGWGGIPGSHPFATGAWRAPANNTNSFARESQMDIMAAKAGANPVAFRLAHLKDEKMRRVLKAATERFGWTPGKAPSGRGFGVACGTDAGTYVATAAEVSVDEQTGEVRVERVVCAQDMGLCINPQGSVIQMEGCITMGLGYALKEDIRFKGGEILDINFDTYEIPRFSWVPEIETIVLDKPNDPPQGGGEPAIVVMGAVIANAVYDAVGARMHQLPMTPERIKAALEG